jgi:D-alanyl-D-alanine carboxypeptidase (penicillin-binding protein 5/6)
MPYTLLQGGRRRRHRRRGAAVAVILLLAIAATLLLAARAGDPRPTAQRTPEAAPPAALLDTGTAPLAGGGTAPSPLAVRLEDPRDVVHVKFKPPRSGLLFDVDTGRVLWRQHPERVLPIASLTKMMTALVVVDRLGPHAKVKITKEALAYTGSGVGLLPRGKRIAVRTMLYGLLLPSGNDAAIALALRAAGSQERFIALMNRRADEMGLVCSRFSTVSGIKDRGNRSCAPDLAAMARAVLREPRLAQVVGSRSAALRFPIKGHKLYLYNNNPLLRSGYKGTTGVKTGYTVAAGRCLVATARRGPIRLGVVLLDSPDPGRQAKRLLDRGFAKST